jgi:hypothetical protein
MGLELAGKCCPVFKCYLNELKIPKIQLQQLNMLINRPWFPAKMDEEILCKLYRQSCKALRKQINSS